MSNYDDPLKKIQQSTSAEAATAAANAARQAAARANVEVVAGVREQERLAGLENTAKNYRAQQEKEKAEREKKRKAQQAAKEAAEKKRIEEEKKRAVGQAYADARGRAYAAAEKYNRTGNPNDLKVYNNANAAYKKATDDYRKVFGRDPGAPEPQITKPKPTATPSAKPSTPTTNTPMGAKPTSTPQPQRREWENPAIGSAKYLTNDPYLQKIIDTAAKAGIDMSVVQAQAQLDGTAGGGGTGGGGSSVSRSYSQYTLQQVQSAADNIFQQSIGRALSNEELKQLQVSLNSALMGSPSVTTTKGEITTTTGGIDERGFIQQQAEMNPEFANYQKATTYFDSMMNALRGPAGGGI